MPLILAMEQGCFADTPVLSWGGQNFERMRVDDCVRWAGRALEDEGYQVTTSGNAIWGYKDPHTAILFCHTAPVYTLVVAGNAASDDVQRQRERLERAMERFARRDRDRDRDRDRRR